MKRTIKGRGRRFRIHVTVLVTLFQLPAVLWLCARTHGLLPLAMAAALSLPYLRQLHSPWSSDGRRLTTYLALAWWASCIVFALLFPVAWLAGKLGAPAGTAYVVGGGGFVVERPVRDRSGAPVAQQGRPHRGLPPELDGYRIGQLSDVHCGSAHAGRARPPLGRAAQRARARSHDRDRRPHHPRLVARRRRRAALGGLRARDGVFACMGNHDYFTDGERSCAR